MTSAVGANTPVSLDGQFKEVYADNINNLIPEGAKLLHMVNFIKAEKQPGNLYHQPVILGHEHGFTYGGVLGNAFQLENAVASSNADARVQGAEIVLRSFLSIAAASRSQNSKACFISETKLLVENMLKSFAKRLEIGLMYGQMGIGTVESITGAGPYVVKIYDWDWAAGIFSGGENMPITILDPTFAANRVDTFVTAVNLDTKEITINAKGTAQADDVIVFKSAIAAGPVYNEFAGLHKIISNSGSLFNINASVYNLWKGNVINVGTDFTGGEAKLSFDSIESAIARAMNKGLNDEEVAVICNPGSWKNLLTEQAAKRMYDSSYSGKEIEQGAKSIKFHGPNGLIEIVPSIYCKEGFAYIIPAKEFMRVGSTDVTFEQPGFEGKFLRLLENHNGYEMRAYTDQALFTSKPGLCCLLRYIKN